MKAVLIDPVARTVTDVEFDGNYRSIYKLLTTEKRTVSTFETLPIEGAPDEVLYLDEEFLLQEPPGEDYFALNGVHTVIGGSGLILGTNPDDGESVATKLTADMVRPQVHWRKLRIKGWTLQTVEEGVTLEGGEDLGKFTRITSPHPILEPIDDPDEAA